VDRGDRLDGWRRGQTAYATADLLRWFRQAASLYARHNQPTRTLSLKIGSIFSMRIFGGFIMSSRGPRLAFAQIVLSLLFAVLLLVAATRAQNSTDPWSAAQTVQPADFAKELSGGKSSPTILFVGFQRLYTAGHIKGTQYHGSGGRPEGVSEIKAWASSLPRSTNLVLYCGCCPLEKCPNIRPAFSALRDMGFTNLRVLLLPTSFAVDWADKGLPYDKGQ
jgi:thiosulfate/3-mercaptopyruvate sulfurtransferase